ncbi:hypothetical protein V8C35DRAFT_268811 [Trichoderma chlorosporum]
MQQSRYSYKPSSLSASHSSVERRPIFAPPACCIAEVPVSPVSDFCLFSHLHTPFVYRYRLQLVSCRLVLVLRRPTPRARCWGSLSVESKSEAIFCFQHLSSTNHTNYPLVMWLYFLAIACLKKKKKKKKTPPYSWVGLRPSNVALRCSQAPLDSIIAIVGEKCQSRRKATQQSPFRTDGVPTVALRPLPHVAAIIMNNKIVRNTKQGYNNASRTGRDAEILRNGHGPCLRMASWRFMTENRPNLVISSIVVP